MKKVIKKKVVKAEDTEVVLKDVMDVNETAKYLKMSVSHLYTLTSTKRIPFIKLLGKKLLFEKNEINAWLNSKKVNQSK